LPPSDGRCQILTGMLAPVQHFGTSPRCDGILKSAPVLNILVGYASSWLFKLTAQAALSAGVPHGLTCEA